MPVSPLFPGVKPGSPAQDPRARDEADRRDRRRGEEIADRCQELEESLEQLRTRYDLYFLGVERREPLREREETRRAVARLKGEMNLATGLRFRIETLHARFLSYDRMWTRTARQKEEGTYRRDLHRVRRRQERQQRQQQRAGAAHAAAEPAHAAAGAPSPAAATTLATPPPVAEASAAPTRTPPPLPAGITAEQLQALHAAYVDAKRRCNEDVSRVTYDALARTVARQVPELLARHQARSVEFKVVVKDGRALLKAIPRD